MARRILGPDDIPRIRLARMSDAIVDRILRGEPRVDVDIAIERMRDACAEWFPDRLELFERIYEARFRRLWEQFRPEG